MAVAPGGRQAASEWLACPPAGVAQQPHRAATTKYDRYKREHRRRAERALASVIAVSYLLGVSTRRVEKLAGAMGVTSLSRSQVSALAAELDEVVESFRGRRMDAGPYTFVWIDALTQKVREVGRTVTVH